jgi:hypothetical protein
MKTGVYRNYNEFSALVLNTLLEMIRRTRGSLVTFNPKKIAVLAGIDTHPVILTLVKDVLEGLREKGLISIAGKSKHGVKYAVTKSSPLWALAKEGYTFTVATLPDLERIGIMASAQTRRTSLAP